jgi:hypothetical protein
MCFRCSYSAVKTRKLKPLESAKSDQSRGDTGSRSTIWRWSFPRQELSPSMDAELQPEAGTSQASSDSETILEHESVVVPPGSPILDWTSIIRVLSDVEPVTAAGVSGLLAIIILSVFGRIGCLVVGLLGGLLLHASIEKRRDHSAWKEQFNREYDDKPAISREAVYPFVSC